MRKNASRQETKRSLLASRRISRNSSRRWRTWQRPTKVRKFAFSFTLHLLVSYPLCYMAPWLPSSQNSVQIFSRIGASFYCHRSGNLFCLFFRRTRRRSSTDGIRQDVRQPFCRLSLCGALLVLPRYLQVSVNIPRDLLSSVARGGLAIASTCKGGRRALVCSKPLLSSPRVPLSHHRRRLCMHTTQSIARKRGGFIFVVSSRFHHSSRMTQSPILFLIIITRPRSFLVHRRCEVTLNSWN